MPGRAPRRRKTGPGPLIVLLLFSIAIIVTGDLLRSNSWIRSALPGDAPTRNPVERFMEDIRRQGPVPAFPRR